MLVICVGLVISEYFNLTVDSILIKFMARFIELYKVHYLTTPDWDSVSHLTS